MQKGVYQLGELSGEPGGYRVYQNGTQGISRTYYSAKENYVTYYVVIANTGEGDLVLDKAVDHLPTGLQYQGMSTNPYYWSVGSGTQNVDLYQITTPEQPYVSLNKPYSFKAITVNAQYAQEKNQLLFSFAKDGGQAVLKSGEAISFIYHCRIDSSATSSELSVNTIGLALEKGTEIDGTLKATHNSSSNVGQANDGNCSAADAIDTEKYNEALGEGSNKYFIESSVAIYPGGIRPGIEKKATKYKMNGSGDFFPITQATQLGINDTVRWEIVVSNYTGTDDIVSYQVTDTLDYPYKVNALEITIYNKENRIVLPKQSLTIHEEEVLGETTTDPPSVYTIMLSDSKYTIPAGGYAVISVDSTQMSGLAVYGAFDNSARLELVQSFTTGDVTNGTVGRNEEGKLVIDSSDEIEILGLYSTKSYKEVWEKDNPENLASSERNAASKVAVIENPDRIVTYALNIINTCAIPLTGFVLVDSMPRIGDTGIFDTYAGRDSEFEVAFAEQLNLNIQVIGKTGTTRQLDPSLYKVEFGEERSFNTSDFNGEANGRWTTEFYQEAQSIRIIISDQVNLVPGEAFRILFDGQCSTEALPGETAWNAFGYQYYTTIQNTETGEYEKTETNLNAAPPKVGIQIQPVPSLKKVVVDEQGNLVDSDGTEEFTFRLYEGKYSLEEITEEMSFVELKVQAGKAVSLSPYLKQFKTYTIVEVLEEGSSYELKYLYLNSDNSMNTVNGYSFLYKGEEDFLLQAVNEIRTCGITIEKVDKDSVGQEKMEYLAGAEFTLERKEGDSYVFVSKLTTPESGVVDFAQLLPGKYLITETKAPDGYQKLKEPITIKLPLSYQAGDLVNGNVVTTDGETTHVKLLVTNAKLSLLPSFGGSGDSTMTVYGLILLATGIFMFGYEKKRSRKGEIV